ncbi:NifU family protein [Candidatus Uhrbacteria bacterium]|nr:NifU family protein [Candidatus Uhrbacteria bacterium]
MHERISAVLAEVGTRLASHQGGVDFVDFDEATGALTVRFTGTCGTCPLAAYTLEHVIAGAVRDRVPEVTRVILGT